MADPQYREFQSKLVPGINPESVLGVRVPVLRNYAKKIHGSTESRRFMDELPHKYYDENMLHALLLEYEKNADECYKMIDCFLPYVDNWAVCDVLNPKAIAKDKKRLAEKAIDWAASDKIYTARFAVDLLMKYFLDEYFEKYFLEIVAGIKSEDYYLRMVVAWYFATALAKQWDDTIPYIERHVLDDWTHKKTIRKAIESYRITDKQKEYLRNLK